MIIKENDMYQRDYLLVKVADAVREECIKQNVQ